MGEELNLVIWNLGAPVNDEVLQDRSDDEIRDGQTRDAGVKEGLLRTTDELKIASGKATSCNSPLKIAVDIGRPNQEV